MSKITIEKKVKFPKKKDLGKREWGKEILLALISKKISFKKLILNKGKSGGLQYHRKKNECGYLLSGSLQVIFVGPNGKLKKKILKKGNVFHFPPGSIHKETALTRCEIIEASTPYFNDRVRVEKKFNLKPNNGLKTTKINHIKYL